MNHNIFICIFLSISIILSIAILVKIESKKENYLSSYCDSWLQFRLTPNEKAFEYGEPSVGEVLKKCNLACKCNGKKCTGKNDPMINPESSYDFDSC